MISGILKAYNESFGVKIFAIFTAMAFIISMSLTFFFIYNQRKSLTASMIKNGTLLSTILAYNARLGVFSENAQLLEDPVKGIIDQEGVLDVSVFNMEKMLLNKEQRPVNAARNSEDPDNKDDLNTIFDNLEESRLPVYIRGNNRFDFWAPVLSRSYQFSQDDTMLNGNMTNRDNRVIGFVRVTVDEIPLKKRQLALLWKSVVIGGISFIIGMFFLFLVVNGTIRPLRRLTDSVRAYGEAGKVDKLPVETRDEIARLAEAFNDMTESLNRRDAEKGQLERALRQSQKMEAIGTLSGGIAHDFNNIMGIVMANTELAMSEIPEGSSPFQKLDGVLKAVLRAKDLVMQILTFSHKGGQEQCPLQISPIVKECLKMLRATLPATIEIRQNIAESPGIIMSDPTRIHQLLINLCTNASYAMRDKGGILKVSLKNVRLAEGDAKQYKGLAAGDYLSLKVEDTGEGIEHEIMERIFEPYFTTKAIGSGSGMGLAVVHGIVQNSGGVIRVESEPGRGTAFEVFFPIVEVKPSAEVKTAGAVTIGSERILFVDDEDNLALAARYNLERFGYNVTSETNPLRALGLFKNKPDQFDLVITDMTMPKMTGDKLARAIMEIRPDIPVIICTGYGDRFSKEQAKEMGIKAFIMKPALAGEMTRIIRDVLDEANYTLRSTDRMPH
ncbi:putative Integral membrane sensor hybrid histidine kinase [uncultured Desulfobacterium sp.]|uniref:histidine kinase n=1 Tax=uncultured Desulfobacterium sp. TaxID=201089 RepID=A0A445MRP4_9BACT|nr:putative Integral membrane sensor hybrid histidine kinase [uncultured Desulfobacterium sp.]